MQRLLSLKHASSSFSKKLPFTNSSLSPSRPYYNAFNSLDKPTHHSCQQQNYIFGFSQVNPTYHFLSSQPHHTLSRIVHGFLSNPLLSKQFASNLSTAHFKFSSKGLAHYKFGGSSARFVRRYSGFNQGFGSYRRSWRSWFYQLSANDMVLGLILANVAVFMLWRVADRKFMANNFMIGRTFGPDYLLKLYVAGAIGGSLFYLVHHAFMALSTKGQGMWMKDTSRTPGLGASGAVNAIMLLDIFLNPRSTLYLDFFIPVPAILLGIFLIGKDVMRILEGNSNISGSAHLGGAAVAAIAYARIRKGRF